MKPEEFRALVRESGVHNRCDLSRLFADRAAFAAAVHAISEPFRGERVTLVAGIESMGLSLAGAVARELSAGVVMLRKPNKVAWTSIRAPFHDYKKEDGYLEVVSDAFQNGDRVLIVDDWTETGAQLAAAADLVIIAGAEVCGVAVLNADAKARSRFAVTGHRLHYIFNYSTES
jgi:adenine phosphoribosyltransferase